MTQDATPSVSQNVLQRLKAGLEKTPAMAAVQQDGDAIRFLTDEQRTPEVCLAAVQQDGHVIEHLSEAQRTPEVVMAAVRQDSRAIKHLRVEEFDREGEAGDRLRAALLKSWGAIEPALSAEMRQAFARVLLAHADKPHSSAERQR